MISIIVLNIIFITLILNLKSDLKISFDQLNFIK